MMKKSILKLLFCSLILVSCTPKEFSVVVENTTSLPRENEDVEVLWREIVNKNPDITAQNLVVLLDGKQQVYQIIYKDKKPESLLFQSSVGANQKRVYSFEKGEPQEFESKVHSRLVPERMDDYAWENNKVAYRMYGPALKATGEISNGIDPWAKRTDKLIIEKWYSHMDYHTDYGEGLDYYKVGRSLGAGATAPLYEGDLVLGCNFVRSELLENGPLRTKFKLYYAPLKVGDIEVVETRIVSLSANSYFNKIEQSFSGEYQTLDLATGIVLRQGEKEIVIDDKKGLVIYREPQDSENGAISISLILGDEFKGSKEHQNHILALSKLSNTKTSIFYYMGNSWDKAGVSFEDWVKVTDGYAKSLETPLKVSFK